MKINHKILPLVGRSYPLGVKKLQEFLDFKGGNVVRGTLPENKEDALAAMRFCRKHGLYVLLGEFVARGYDRPNIKYSRRDLEDIFKMADGHIIGRFCLGEAGGILYWPERYTIDQAAKTWKSLTPCDGPAQAHEELIKYFKHVVTRNIEVGSDIVPLATVESSHILEYQAEAGCKFFMLEMCPGNPLEMIPSFRGTARAHDTFWGTHIAIGWYGGVHFDELWLQRWKMCLYLSFLHGADVIYPESGDYSYRQDKWGCTDYDFERDHPNMLRARAIQREFYRFTQIHQRPHSDPETPLAVVFGHLEGYPNLWNPYAWGQYQNGEHWEAGPAEHGWDLPQVFCSKENIFNETVMGDFNNSGNAPGGLYDVVPVCGDFSRYRALIFVGWNTMTTELYQKLIDYVLDGGRLLIFPAHFNVEEKRANPVRLFNGGDFTELCGIRIKAWGKTETQGFKFVTDETATPYTIPYWGTRHDPWWLGKVTPGKVEFTGEDTRILAGYSHHIREYREDVLAEPALIENRLGKGVVWTVAVAEYPGDEGMKKFAAQLLRIIGAGEQPETFLTAPDCIRYATYETPEYKIMYLLNTEPDSMQGVRLSLSGKRTQEFLMAPAEFKVVYIFGDTAVLFTDHNIRIYSVKQSVDKIELGIYSLSTQKPVILGTPKKVIYNGKADICEAFADPEVKEFFDDDFLSEPDITQYSHHELFVSCNKKLQD